MLKVIDTLLLSMTHKLFLLTEVQMVLIKTPLFQVPMKWELNMSLIVILLLLNKLNYIFPKLFLNLPNLPQNGKQIQLTTLYCVKILKLLMKFFTELFLNIMLSTKRNNKLPPFLRLKEKFSKKLLVSQLVLLHLLKHLPIKLLKLSY